ncbi:hypothetical protein [Cohnella sp.]|uniref:hypothetical protein n=1 Tax=Cohnella sp. TaxID=1883426 RepID=UPI0035646440
MINKFLMGFLTMLTVCLLLSACDSNEKSIEKAKKKISIEEANKLILETQDFSQSSNMENGVIEITPSEIWDKTKIQLFKDSSSETYIVTNQKAVHIGEAFGGFGVTSALPYDVNKDGTLDLVYAGMNESLYPTEKDMNLEKVGTLVWKNNELYNKLLQN